MHTCQEKGWSVASSGQNKPPKTPSHQHAFGTSVPRSRAFAAASDDDDQNRSLDALGDDFFERSRTDRENTRATPAGDLQYAGERPGNWQEFDIIFSAPKFSNSGNVLNPARITVFHNGVLIQNNVYLTGPTCYIGQAYYVKHPEKLPILLQNHGNPVRFRNIWVRKL